MTDSPYLASEQARGWYRAATHGLPKDYARFIALWEALFAWFRDVLDKSNDKEMKCWLKDNLGEWHRDSLRDSDYRARVHGLKQVTPIGRMKGAQQVDEVSITDELDFGQIVGAIYTVRCNLMKGGKPATPKEREVQVCHAASEVLDTIVEHLAFGTQAHHSRRL